MTGVDVEHTKARLSEIRKQMDLVRSFGISIGPSTPWVGPVGHIFVKCAGMWIIPWHDTAEDPLEQNGSVTVLFTPGEAG